MTEPLSRSDVTAKAMEVVKWLEGVADGRRQEDDEIPDEAKDALQVIFYLARVNTALENRLAEIAHTAVQPVHLQPGIVSADSDHLAGPSDAGTQENGDTSTQTEGAVADVDD